MFSVTLNVWVLSHTSTLQVSPHASRKERKDQSMHDRSNQRGLTGHPDTAAHRRNGQENTR